MKKRRNCRIWWPIHLSSTAQHSPSSIFFFGWFASSSSASLDIIVAFACDEASLSCIRKNLQEILHETNGNLPISLQGKCIFSMLGCRGVDSCGSGRLLRVGIRDNTQIDFAQDAPKEKYGRESCGCHRLDGSFEQYRLEAIKRDYWIQLAYDSVEYIGKKIERTPKPRHIHWNGQIVSEFDLHVIYYETPRFGGHHFSMGFQTQQVQSPLTRPGWIKDLDQKQPPFDMDDIILAINSVSATKLFFEGIIHPERSTIQHCIVCILITFTWQLFSVSVASFSTVLYIIVQFLHAFLYYGSQSIIYITSAKVFCSTWQNIQIHCCQILYWPVSLQDNGLRSRSCVESAEKAALDRHSMWSCLVVDTFLGYLFGILLLFHANSACTWVSNFANECTNSLLRTSCVWLMGNPAGFKLNTELAGVLGIVSLNAIQIWSTLWSFVGFLFIYFVKGLAISGILLGMTTPAGLIKDTISLATLHVSTLYWIISFLYSRQIQATAALWHLFRGRKWNPLRKRLDSYNYSVEQHIVGSLLFTPLLLLLPTTSAFYIFFTIMNVTISFICKFIEIFISIIHSTPYPSIFLWLVRPRRFPSGIWFESTQWQSNGNAYPASVCVNNVASLPHLSGGRSRSTFLASFLHSNFLTIRQILWPHYRPVFSEVSKSSVATSGYGILTGQSNPFVQSSCLPAKLPWMSISFKEYWRLCCDAVLACKLDAECKH